MLKVCFQSMSKQNSEYLFLMGKIRVLEKDLFDYSKFNRLMENRSVPSFLNDLSDSKYHGFIIKDNFEKGLRNYIYFQYDYFRKNMADTAILDIFMIKNDILNYINYLKDFKKDEFYESGVFKNQWWKVNKLPPFFVKAEYRLKKMLPQQDVANAEERIIEKVCMDVVCEEYLKSIQSNMVLNYWKFMIDIKNLLKNINHPQPRYYFSGGNIKESFWKEIKIGEDMPDKLEAQPYIKEALKENSRIKWELILKQWLGGLIKEMRKITFGPEPIVSYFLSIIEEAVNLNLIYTGIRMNFSAIELKENLNLTYV